MLSASSSGSFDKVEKFLKNSQNGSLREIFDRYGKNGVTALSAATPIESGETARSWKYNTRIGRSSATIAWTNSHIENEISIAIILQYGHGTRTGGWVEGKDYINPAMRPIFDDMAQRIWEEVTKNG